MGRSGEAESQSHVEDFESRYNLESNSQTTVNSGVIRTRAWFGATTGWSRCVLQRRKEREAREKETEIVTRKKE